MKTNYFFIQYIQTNEYDDFKSHQLRDIKTTILGISEDISPLNYIIYLEKELKSYYKYISIININKL